MNSYFFLLNQIEMPNLELDDDNDEEEEFDKKNRMDIEKEDFNDNMGQIEIKLENYSNIETITELIKKEGKEDLQKFTVVDYIGRGIESLVFKIRLNGTNNYYVLKVMKKHKNKSNYSELLISRKIKHKNIANTLCYYVDSKNKFDYIIMELGNSNLINFSRKVLKRATLSEDFLCMATYHVLQGLAYLHKCKIAHLDIKPQNIIITDYLDTKLIDFSVSLDYSQMKGQEINLPYAGTAYMMSPEIIMRKKIKIRDLQKVDLFSLGVTIYVLAFGHYPFEFTKGDDDETIYSKINSGWKVTDEDNNFSNHFINFLNGLLESDINKRLNIRECLNHYWVQGAQILLNEKENTYNANSFLSYLITNHFRSFEEYISH